MISRASLRTWFKRVGLVLLLPTLAGALLTGWLTVKVLTYKQVDDPIRLQSKAAYLGKVSTGSELRRQNNKPNILLILYDDLGLGDLGFSGASAIKTPNIDALARDGVIFNNFHAAAAICSPSRASLLTGRLPHHAGVQSVVFPSDSWMRLFSILPGFNVRIPAEEITLADILKADGYKTAMVGKWHIGDRAPSLPHLMGFDQFFGALYSNDMEPFALYRDDAVELDAPIDQDQLDEIYTNEMVRLISESSESAAPFFLYFAHNFPHEPLHAPAARVHDWPRSYVKSVCARTPTWRIPVSRSRPTEPRTPTWQTPVSRSRPTRRICEQTWSNQPIVTRLATVPQEHNAGVAN